MLLILFQLTLLLLTTWGWGFWLWKISGAEREPSWKHLGWLFFGLGGFAAHVLFLHALIYFDLPLQWTAWIGLVIALAGVLACLLGRAWQRSTTHPRQRREVLAAGVLFVTVFAWQGAPLCATKPSNYYGNAHTDQVNYVLLAQFLIEKPFSTSLAEVGLQPWIVKPIHLKNVRLGQSVANGYLGVVSLTDAKRAYGTLSIFVVCASAVAVFALARTLSVPRNLAACVGLWWGILPAVTKMHLDGFFSQTCVLFVFPAIAALYRVRRGRFERAPLLLLTVYLAYLLCTYTEVYVLGVGLFVSLAVLAAPVDVSWKTRACALGAVLVAAPLLTVGYLRVLLRFLAQQYEAASSPTSLASLVPMSGTWIGWKQIFFGYVAWPDARLERASILAGLALIFLIVCAFQGREMGKRRFLLAAIAPVLGVLALLLSVPELPKYPFSKLLDTFATFWLVLAVVGLWYVGGLFLRRRIWVRAAAWPVVTVLGLTALAGSWPQWRAVRQNQGILAAVNSPIAQRCYSEARQHPENVYLVAEPNRILCAWLTFAARHSKVYVEDDFIGDQPVSATLYAFRRLPALSGALVLLGDGGPKRLIDAQGQPELLVRNPQGVDGGGSNVWYWIGAQATLELTDYTSPPGSASHPFALAFDVLAGPSNPSPARSLVLLGPGGSEQKFDFLNQATCRFLVDVHPGKNVFTLKVAYPTEEMVKSSDPRNLMVRATRFTVTKRLAAEPNQPAAQVNP